jgi:hypothetical protein
VRRLVFHRTDIERPWTSRTVAKRKRRLGLLSIDHLRNAFRSVPSLPGSGRSAERCELRAPAGRAEEASGRSFWGLLIAALALVAAGCVELDVTRLPRSKASAPDGEARSGYLCGLLTPSPVRSYFSPEWKRLTLAVVTPSRKSGTKATVDFSGFDKDGRPGAFPCVPVEEGEPAVVAFEVEGNHGSVERAARQTLATVTEGLVADLVPVKLVAQSANHASNGLEGVALSHGVAATVFASDSWCAKHPGTCFASYTNSPDGAPTPCIVGPRGVTRRVEEGSVVDEKGKPVQGVAVTLSFEAAPRADALPAECATELETPGASQFTACTSAAAIARMTRVDGRAFRDLLSALALGASESLPSATRVRAVQEARSGICRPGRFEVPCARAASMEGELVDLREGDEAETSLKIGEACDGSAKAQAVLDGASVRLARHPTSRALLSQSKVLAALAHDNRVACFKGRAIARCGSGCPVEWLAKVNALPGSSLILGFDEDGCRANSLRRFAHTLEGAAEGLTTVEEIRATVRAAASPNQEKITAKWCSDVARLSDILRSSGLFRELDAADAALSRLSPSLLDVDVADDAPQRYLALRAKAPLERVAALLEEGEALKKQLPGLFGSAEDGAPKLRAGAQDRLEADVSAHVRFVRGYLARVASARPVPVQGPIESP